MSNTIHLQTDILINLGNMHIVFDYIKNGIAITDEHSMIIYTNPDFTRITGYTKDEAKNQNPGMLHSGKHGKDFYEAMWLAIKSDGFWEGEIWNRRKSGEIYPEYLTISKIDQYDLSRFFYIAIFSDISFLKNDTDKKMHLAFYDPLTELPNRNLYLDRATKFISHNKNEPLKGMVIFYMDLDKFKHVNDTYGHVVGDKLLKMVGQRLASIVRAGDTIARIGGDEFAVIITSDCNKLFAINFAKRILKNIEKKFIIDGHSINISISIGITFSPADANNIEALLENADKAMYLAKKSGSKIECYSAE